MKRPRDLVSWLEISAMQYEFNISSRLPRRISSQQRMRYIFGDNIWCIYGSHDFDADISKLNTRNCE